MSQFPQIFSAQQSVDDGSDEVAIGVVCYFEGLTQIVENIDLILEGIKALFCSSGIEEHGGNELQNLVVRHNFFDLQQGVDEDIDNVEIYELDEDLSIVPDVEQDFQHHFQADEVVFCYRFRHEIY
jgi:hypothetical protein